jgi:hypothetical protein
MTTKAVLAGLTLVALLPVGAAAQDWRTVTSSRQYSGEDAIDVDIEYGAGELRIQPGAKGTLYRSTLRYDGKTFRPVTSYSDGRLKLGIEGGKNVRLPRNHSKARLDLTLGPDAPMNLDLEFGAVEAEIELGGLRLRNVAISTGASETKLRFSEPNPEHLEQIKLEAGAASFSAYGLGNANADVLDFDGGVGDIRLDFSGAWKRDMRAKVDIGLGSLTLVFPDDIGVRIQKETFLMSFDPEGMIKRGNAYYSGNWDRAERKVSLDIDGALGSIEVRWIAGVASR